MDLPNVLSIVEVENQIKRTEVEPLDTKEYQPHYPTAEDYSKEQLETAWKSFFEEFRTKNSMDTLSPTLSSLFNSPISKKNNQTLLVQVSNIHIFQKQLTKIKPQLIPYLKKQLKQNELVIELANIKNNPLAENNAYLMNTKEKYALILEKNSPRLKDFLDEFGFKPLS